MVHQLVLLAFVGPCPAGMEACHDPDPNPANNNLSNLRWGTRQSNADDRGRHGRTARGERSGQAKLTAEMVQAIRTRAGRGASAAVLAAEHCVSEACIRSVVSRKTWKHVC